MEPREITCEGCGVCCLRQQSPPGYIAVLGGVWPEETGDVERAANLPLEARKELETYLVQLREGHGMDETPCLWLDQVTMLCRYYEHRPSVCRDFKVGGEGCLAWRKEFEL